MSAPASKDSGVSRQSKWMAAAIVLTALITVVVAVRSTRSGRGKEGRTPTSLDEREKAPNRIPVSPTRPTWVETDDPRKDGWDTEAFHLGAKRQLAALGELLTGREIDASRLAGLVTEDVACGALLPRKRVTVFKDAVFQTTRTEKSAAASTPKIEGVAGLSTALKSVVAEFSEGSELRAEFKVFEVTPADGDILTRVFVTISGLKDEHAQEHHATWKIRWTKPDQSNAPRMRSLVLEDFEQSAARSMKGPLFSDCTHSVLGGNEMYAPQLLRGMNHWLEMLQLQDTRYFALLGTPGLAVGDVNGDGLDDLYLCQESGLPNRLFIQQPDGTAHEESNSWGVDWLEDSRSALLIDLDNDADQDLAVAILGGIVLAENDGNGRFHLREVLPTSDDTMSLSAADVDHDGRLDLYVCVYASTQTLENTTRMALPSAISEGAFVTHDANDGGANSLWRNEFSPEGGWRFTDFTKESGLGAQNQRYSNAAAWEDFDLDGDLDLYVANDFGRDNFYRNDRKPGGESRFTEVAEKARVEDAGSGMAVTCGDYDRDGWMDVMVSNMWSSAGQRVTRQKLFKPRSSPDIVQRYRRLARGNTLLRNQGDGTFADQSGPTGVELGRWAWGSHFLDLNNDGWEDLFVANGFITTGDTGDL
jgi:hypothetical protein